MDEKLIYLLEKFEKNEIEEKDLSHEEFDLLKDYYLEQIQILDKEIAEKKQKLEEEKLELISKYKTAIDLKETTINNFKVNKVKEILKKAGCRKEIFGKISDYTNVDIDNLTNIISFLNKFKYSKLEMSKILTENIDILNTKYENINNNIGILFEYWNDSIVIKQMIYDNPFILTQDYDLSEICKIFSKYEINPELQKYIMIQNASVLTLESVNINNSLNLIREVCGIQNKFIETITRMPELIGYEEKEKIAECINS